MKKGVTLIEVLLVVSILVLMVGVTTGALNPIALINKGRDAKRKKDVTRIKIAMEEYMADNGCFPADPFLTELTSEAHCGTDVFSPWLNSWPCDPNGSSYYLLVEEVDRPGWFKIIVYLENEKDKDIPSWWYDNSPGSYLVGDGSLSNADVNFGVSSTNVLWYERVYPGYCSNTGQCHYAYDCDVNGENCSCNPTLDPTACVGDNCYTDGSCRPACKVSCCEDGQPCD